MDFIHIKSLDKYHPGYKDRTLQWAKIYFNMVQGDPEFELIESEIDKWRYVALVCLELQAQNPLPILDTYFKRKGFDLRKRPMSLTLKMLHNFINIVTIDSNLLYVDKNKNKIKSKSKIANSKFVKPTKIELDVYCKKMNYRVNTEKFLAHYNSNGWKVGKNPMKSWESALTTWHLTEKNGSPTKPKKRINHYDYKCPNCTKIYHKRELKGDVDYDLYRCDENACQTVGLGKYGKNMVGVQLEFIKAIYKE